MSEIWRKTEDLYHAALELEADEREKFLIDSCAGDEQLRRNVERLLKAHEMAQDFMSTPALEVAARATASTMQQESLVGRQVSHYDVQSFLGAGGMGEVYLARDRRLDRLVALKILPADVAATPERLERFVREARAASAFNHPNVAAIYDIGEAAAMHFIAMEYVNGETLATKLAAHPLEPPDIVNIAIQVADALSEAHNIGIVHRDIKPANLMLTSRGQVKVLDFGLAKSTSAEARTGFTLQVTQAGTVMGTVQYMSPEQILGRDIDHRTDIFSFGVVLYEMATGKVPFAGVTMGETTDLILHAQPKPITTLPNDSALGRIINKCLEKDREQRYRSAHDLLTDLKNVQQSSGAAVLVGQAHISGALPRAAVRKAISRRSWFVLAAVVSIIVAVAVWLKYTPRVLSFAARDWVLVTDVENQTGDAVFDKSLQTAFVIGMEQSHYGNVLPRSRVTQSLKMMKRSGDEPLDETLGREVALREGVRALIIPSIRATSGAYELAARIHDPARARDIQTERVQAAGKDSVLHALDQLVGKVRADLGESLPSIAASSKPLSYVTTSSMEALRQYSLAIENHRAARFDQARVFYENAVRIDPTFTAAKGSLGMIMFENFDRQEGKRQLADVIQRLDNLNEKERYGLQAFYAVAVENDAAKAVQFYKVLLGLYPDDWSSRQTLGWLYYQMKRGEDAAAELKEALRVNPTAMITFNALILDDLYLLGDINGALDLSKKQVAIDDHQPFAYQNMGWAYLGKGDLAAAEQAFRKSLEIDDKVAEVRSWLGHTLLLQKKYRDAEEMYLSATHFDPNEYDAYYGAGLACQVSGDRECENQNFTKFVDEVNNRIKKRPREASYHFALARVALRTGQRERAQAEDAQAIKLSPNSHYAIAQFLSVQDKTDEAIDRLGLAIDSGFRNFVWMKIDPDLRNLQSAPRFQELLKERLKN